MGAGRKTQTVHASANFAAPAAAAPGNNLAYPGFRGLRKSDLAGVIFGCKHDTMNECLTKQLFGLPSMHYSYIRNIDPRLPLFLFNYSDRQMHGIFEAAGPGQMNIDPYAWSDDGTVRTPFPAQIRVYTKTPCLPLNEDQFKKVIKDNYFTAGRFWFELDRAQTRKLICLFKPGNPGYAPLSIPLSVDLPPTILGNAQPNISYENTLLNNLNLANPASAAVPDNWSCSKSTTSDREVKDSGEVQDTWANQVEWEKNYNYAESGFDAGNDNNDMSLRSSQLDIIAFESEFDEQAVFNKLRSLALEREELKGHASQNLGNELALGAEPEVRVPGETSDICHLQLSQSNANKELMQIVKELVAQTTEMQKNQVESDKEVERLTHTVNQSGRKIFQLESRLEELELRLSTSAQCTVQSEKLMYLVGGYDSAGWLSSFDAFSPFKDTLMPLKRMSTAKAYPAVTTLEGVIFVVGGGDDNSCSDIVECYDRSADEWIRCPPLSCSKGSLAGVTLGDKIFVMGGGNGENCFSCVEMLDVSARKWVFAKSMNEKRFAPAAIELKGAIYTVGGYDGKYYLNSAERYDPREGYWARVPSMNERRGCLSLAMINEKLYAIGGFDGGKMVSSMEIFDPRFPSWVPGMPMQEPRGYAASAMINDTLYMMGGLSDGNVIGTVECFNQRTGWHALGLKSIGKRCFFSAAVI